MKPGEKKDIDKKYFQEPVPIHIGIGTGKDGENYVLFIMKDKNGLELFTAIEPERAHKIGQEIIDLANGILKPKEIKI